MKRNRILHLRASSFVGGPEHQLLRYAEGQRDSVWDILLATFVGPEEGREFIESAEQSGLETIGLPTDRQLAVRALVQCMRQEDVDVLCTHGYKADILGIVAARLARVPVACFLRGWTAENWRVRAYERADRWFLPYADRIVCLSNSQATRLTVRGSLAGKIRVVCNAIDWRKCDENARNRARIHVRECLQLPIDCRVVATAGRLSPEKGVADFLLAASRVYPNFPDVRFVIFGSGALRYELEQQVKNFRLQDRVTFAGFRRDLQDLLPGIDFLVNPSLSEEMPNILLEAMAFGVPVIATNVGGVSEIAGPEHSVRLVPPGLPQRLADTIRDLLMDSASARELAEAGLRRVRQVYSLPAQRSQFEALYEEILFPYAQSSGQRSRSTQRSDAAAEIGEREVLTR
jgi:glycosyltransferase involved in cell wall biosynthesis